MLSDLLHTFLDLGDATSRNLDFAHRSNYQVSYGEETITETNLLELLRRHPDVIQVHTFSKAEESQNGADWEWIILGRTLQFTMRVQAKRIQKNGSLKVKHSVGEKKEQQIDLLLEDAQQNGIEAFYCIYCCRNDQNIWNAEAPQTEGLRRAEFGCLMVDAEKVKAKMPKNLAEIESDCFPWHYIVYDDGVALYQPTKTNMKGLLGTHLKFLEHSAHSPGRTMLFSAVDKPERPNRIPTPDELNGYEPREPDRRGLALANPEEAFRQRTDAESAAYEERRISKSVVLDVRSFEPRRGPGA